MSPELLEIPLEPLSLLAPVVTKIESSNSNQCTNDTLETAVASGVSFRTNPAEFTEAVIETSEENINEEEDEDEDYPEGGIEAWSVVLASFLGLFAVFGLCTSMGAVQAYVAVYQLSNKSESQISWIFSVFIFFIFLLASYVGPIYDAYGPYQLIITGTFLFTLGLITTSFCVEYYQFFLAFSVCTGIGGALLVTPIVSIIGQWFDKRRATAMALATVGGSVGGIVYPLMLRKLYSSIGYPWALRVLGFLCLGLLIFSLLLMKTRMTTPEDSRSIRETVTRAATNMFDYHQLQDLRFTGLAVANFLGEIGITNCQTFLTSYALAQNHTEGFSYSILAILNASGIAGRIITGFLADKLGRFNTVIASCAMSALTVFVVWLPFGATTAGLIAFALTHGFCNVGIVALAPACCGQICRTRDYGKRYGFMYFVASVTILIGVPISGALITNEKDYTNFIIFDGVVYIATTLALLYSRYAAVGFRWCKW
ncbi:uncharacterized protein SAPINGB_P001829 [Magnusiomyces paraingens]|uniref:Major facilitator superfamily (MFS) profile domain-containing protein n=1 Tax=Magnusiomyces paraingens TaxID=2606893 RepID=A0A5E8BBF0_9ASCO|nr:uncharacterized protein SAPINGB_P001829 [Saprochaete ingens]VVT48541.1 unnamed protein product [Saprochaete ingens]